MSRRAPTLRRPSVRGRLAMLSAVAVAVAVTAVSATAWVAAARTMRAQVDQTLEPLPRAGPETGPPAVRGQLAPQDRAAVCDRLEEAAVGFGRALIGVQLVFSDGTTCGSAALGTVTPTAADVAATGRAGSVPGVGPGGLDPAGPPPDGPAAPDATAGEVRDDVTSLDVPVRVRVTPLGDGTALLLLRDVTDVEDALRQLGLVLAAVAGLGSLAALGAGWVVARASLRPLDDLTGAAERIAATEDLDVPIPVTGSDEIARLGVAFNHMTSALSASRMRQQQLVADASHELRTPLTSLRTNVELLARADAAGRAVPPEQRRALLDSLVAQTVELGDLVSELTVLAHDDAPVQQADVDLVEVVRRAARRAGLRGEQEIVVAAAPWRLRGDPVALERAVLNLLDNAMKFSPPTTEVRVRLDGGVLDVDDAGPGIPPDDRARVFDRFWRSASARGMRGSGLGLAIVADTTAAHGGSAEVLDSPLGGTRVRLRLPGSSAAPGALPDGRPQAGAEAAGDPPPSPSLGGHDRAAADDTADGTADRPD